MKYALRTMVLAMILSAGVWTVLEAKKAARPKFDPKSVTIAVIPKGTTHEFWKSIHAGAVKASRETGVQIIWKGPLREDDREAQIAEVENFISRNVSAIVLAPLDETALAVPVASAVKNGITVVVIDSGLKGEAGKDFASFVATDNYKGGQIAANHLAKLLKKRGKIIVLRYQEGSQSTMKREQGFMDAMAKYKNIKILISNQYAGATTESAYKASENLLAPYKTADGKLSVDGIFCPNESSTFGMLRALQDAQLAGKVRFVGFDSSEKLVEALKRGELDGLVLQDPMRMGYLGVKTAVAHLSGRKVASRVDTGVGLVTRQNMEQQKYRELLKPDLAKWLQ